MAKETPPPARTRSSLFAKSPRFTGKSFVTSHASSRGPFALTRRLSGWKTAGAAPGARAVSPEGSSGTLEPAAGGVSIGRRECRRVIFAAALDHLRAARVERAAGGRRRQVGRLPIDGGEPLARVAEARDGAEQGLRVGMGG